MRPPTGTAKWYKVTLPASECGTKAAILRNDFETLFELNGGPNGAALFRNDGDESQDQVFYFSPGAVAIALGLIQHFSGEPCGIPVSDAENPKLLVGRASEREVLLKRDEVPRSAIKRELNRFLRRQ